MVYGPDSVAKPGLVIVASLASRHGLPSVSERCIPTPVSDCGLYKDPISPGEPNVTSESHFAEEKPRKLWNVLITCYTVLMSTYIVVLLYQKTEIDRSPTFIIAGGAGFIACGAYIYTVLSRPGTIIESTTESRSSSDSRFATSVLVQAFFLATLIAVFTPSEGTVQYFLLTSGVLQAFRWASIYHLVRKNNVRCRKDCTNMCSGNIGLCLGIGHYSTGSTRSRPSTVT